MGADSALLPSRTLRQSRAKGFSKCHRGVSACTPMLPTPPQSTTWAICIPTATSVPHHERLSTHWPVWQWANQLLTCFAKNKKGFYQIFFSKWNNQKKMQKKKSRGIISSVIPSGATPGMVCCLVSARKITETGGNHSETFISSHRVIPKLLNSVLKNQGLYVWMSFFVTAGFIFLVIYFHRLSQKWPSLKDHHIVNDERHANLDALPSQQIPLTMA